MHANTARWWPLIVAAASMVVAAYVTLLAAQASREFSPSASIRGLEEILPATPFLVLAAVIAVNRLRESSPRIQRLFAGGIVISTAAVCLFWFATWVQSW